MTNIERKIIYSVYNIEKVISSSYLEISGSVKFIKWL